MAFRLFPSHVPIVDAKGYPTREFIKAMEGVFNRLGGGSRIGPSAPTGLGYAADRGGVRVYCTANPAAEQVIAYQWRLGATWEGGTVLVSFGTNDEVIPSSDVGTYTVWVAAADVRGNYSTPSSMSVTVTGADIGIYGPAVTLATNGVAFVNLQNGGGLTPASILLTAITLNLPTPTYVWKVNDVVQAGQVSSSFSLAAFTGADSKVVRCDVTSGALTAYDVYTIYSVNEGDDAVIAGLSNENHSVLVDAGGTAVSGLPAVGTMTVALGAQVLASGVAYSVAATSNATASINASTGVYSVTAIAADTATVTFRATYNGVTYDKVMSLNKSYPGATGATGSAGTRGSRTLYAIDAAYTSTYDIDGAGGTAAGAASYKAKSTQLIAAATSGSTPTTPIKGDEVVFSNGSDYVTTYTNDGTYGTNGDNSWALPGTVIDGSLLVSGSVTAAKINVANLAALSANLGSVTAGSITGTANIDIAGAAAFNGTQTVDGSGYAVVVNSGGTAAAYGMRIYGSASGMAIHASNAAGGGAIYGTATSGTGYGVYGYSTSATGAGVIAGGTGGATALKVEGPMTINNTTKVTNLNADLLDGNDSSAFATSGHNHSGTYETVANVAKAFIYQSVSASAGALLGYIVVQSTDGTVGPVKIPYYAMS